jgi:hypothetical protein
MSNVESDKAGDDVHTGSFDQPLNMRVSDSGGYIANSFTITFASIHFRDLSSFNITSA